MADRRIFPRSIAAASAGLALLLACPMAHASALQAAEGLARRVLEKGVDGAVKADSHQLHITPPMFERPPAAGEQRTIKFRTGNDRQDKSSLSEQLKDKVKEKLIDAAASPVTECIPGSKHPKDCALRGEPHR